MTEPNPDGVIGPQMIARTIAAMNTSGIRRILSQAVRLPDPINLSIGQPDFPVPGPITQAAIAAIEAGQNGYAMSRGAPDLLARIALHLAWDIGWQIDLSQEETAKGPSLMATSGTSGALLCAMLALLDPGDEVILPEPYFVAYPDMIRMAGGVPVLCDTHPGVGDTGGVEGSAGNSAQSTGFRMTAELVEPLITPRTKAVLFNSPANPAGVVAPSEDCTQLLELCRARGVVLISDEIYDEFCFDEARSEPACGDPAAYPNFAPMRCPSPARRAGADRDVLLVRGFGKTYGNTGWRLGYAAGPRWLIDQMVKIQQYTFVCPPTPLMAGATAALDIDVRETVKAYERRRDMVLDGLGDICEIIQPGGAFYVYAKLPEASLPLDAFIDRCIEREVLVIPGDVFSRRATHLRISYAAPPERLARGVEILRELVLQDLS